MGQKFEFGIGDVVKLKSGGPSMTVEKTGKDTFSRDTVWCVWFDKTDRKQGMFPPEALELDD